jgi:transposase
MNQFIEEYDFGRGQLKEANRQLEVFAATGPVRERELRELLKTIPGVGFVTAEVILAELADISRFRSQSQVVAYAGLAPGQRESAGRSQELHLEKTGSRLLRAMMVEAAWRLVRHSPRWKGIYEKLKTRIRAKKAIVAVARRLLTLAAAILQTGRPYSAAYVPGPAAV